jgi:hypothetical protein
VQSVTQTEPAPTARPQGKGTAFTAASTAPVDGSILLRIPRKETFQSAAAPKRESSGAWTSARASSFPLRAETSATESGCASGLRELGCCPTRAAARKRGARGEHERGRRRERPPAAAAAPRRAGARASGRGGGSSRRSGGPGSSPSSPANRRRRSCRRRARPAAGRRGKGERSRRSCSR